MATTAQTTGLTKMDAARRAMDALGSTATPTELQTYLKDKFGITITVGHAKTCKAKILRERAGKPAAPAKPAAAPAAPPAPKASAPAEASPKAIGPAETKPAAPATATKKTAAAKKTAAKKPPVAKPVPPASPPKVVVAAEGIHLSDVATVKGLVARVGPDGLKRLIDLFSK